MRNAIECARPDARAQGRSTPDETLGQIPGLRRALRRGLGGPRHTAPFPLERSAELPGAADPLSKGGPRRPRSFLVAGSWWMTREIEIANATVSDITVHDDGEVAWLLPASKTDITALGATRAHRCICGAADGAPPLADAALCPACAVSTHIQLG